MHKLARIRRAGLGVQGDARQRLEAGAVWSGSTAVRSASRTAAATVPTAPGGLAVGHELAHRGGEAAPLQHPLKAVVALTGVYVLGELEGVEQNGGLDSRAAASQQAGVDAAVQTRVQLRLDLLKFRGIGERRSGEVGRDPGSTRDGPSGVEGGGVCGFGVRPPSRDGGRPRPPEWPLVGGWMASRPQSLDRNAKGTSGRAGIADNPDRPLTPTLPRRRACPRRPRAQRAASPCRTPCRRL